MSYLPLIYPPVLDSCNNPSFITVPLSSLGAVATPDCMELNVEDVDTNLLYKHIADMPEEKQVLNVSPLPVEEPPPNEDQDNSMGCCPPLATFIEPLPQKNALSLSPNGDCMANYTTIAAPIDTMNLLSHAAVFQNLDDEHFASSTNAVSTHPPAEIVSPSPTQLVEEHIEMPMSTMPDDTLPLCLPNSSLLSASASLIDAAGNALIPSSTNLPPNGSAPVFPDTPRVCAETTRSCALPLTLDASTSASVTDTLVLTSLDLLINDFDIREEVEHSSEIMNHPRASHNQPPIDNSPRIAQDKQIVMVSTPEDADSSDNPTYHSELSVINTAAYNTFQMPKGEGYPKTVRFLSPDYEILDSDSPAPTYSSLPSSSPPRIFSPPPPPDDDVYVTPPSSSPVTCASIDDDFDGVLEPGPMGCSSEQPQNTTRDAFKLSDAGDPNINVDATQESDVLAPPLISEGMPQELQPSPVTVHSPPNPRRLTLASQKRQHIKLAKPFRSPIINNDSPLLSGKGPYAGGKSDGMSPSERLGSMADTVETKSAVTIHPAPMKDYTRKTVKPFKSPLSQDVVSGLTLPLNEYTETASAGAYSSLSIQGLQGKVQRLKQAIKIKQDGSGREDEHLATVISKWRAAGREIAWEVWETVKDLSPGENTFVSPFGGSWDQDAMLNSVTMTGKRGRDEWDQGPERVAKRARMENSGWGQEAHGHGSDNENMGMDVNVMAGPEEDVAAAPQHTLGTMLRFMGIAPETLGWDEDEGDFIGEP